MHTAGTMRWLKLIMPLAILRIRMPSLQELMPLLGKQKKKVRKTKPAGYSKKLEQV